MPHSTKPGALAAALDPCDAPQSGAPCTVDPTQIEVAGTTPPAIEVAWVAEKGRPVGAPAPAQSSVVITKSTACGKNVSCWSWPFAFTVPGPAKPWILNGTYQVTACTIGGTTTCPAASTSTPASLGLAVPPAPPASFKTTYSAANGVDVTWRPVVSPPPDMVGYEVTREGAGVYACRTGVSGPVPAPACPAKLAFHDDPQVGDWTYAVSSLRYGADALIAGVVPSAPLTSTVQVASAPTGPVTLSPGVPNGLPLLPYYGSQGSIEAVPPPATIPPVTTPVATTTAPSETGPQGLQYGDNGGITGAEASAVETGPRNPNLDAWAALALGLLALALATHVWYIRRELRAFTAQRRRAGRPLTSETR